MIWEEHAYLMVDLKTVASAENCSMVREEPYKHPENPVSDWGPAAKPRGRGMVPLSSMIWCVHREGGTYRAWYAAGKNQFAYAESDDGIHFRPTKVGVVSFDGSKSNNRVDPTCGDPNVRACRVMHDPLDREYPYKSVVLKASTMEDFNPGTRAKFPGVYERMGHHMYTNWFVRGLARSKDGFHWQLPEHDSIMIDEIIEEPSPFRALDGGMVIGNQMVTPASDINYRKVKGWVTFDDVTASRVPDYIFKLPDHMVMVRTNFLGLTSLTDIPWVQSHVNLVPMRKGPSLIALHGFLYGNSRIERYVQTADAGLAVSDTGYLFHMVWPFQAFIRRGDMGAWDCQFIRQQAMAETDDRTLMYYHGCNVGNVSKAGPTKRAGAGIAYVPKDRFGYFVLKVNMDHVPRKRRGCVTLKPIRLPAKPRIAVNVSNVTKTRTVRLEIRDANGHIIPGFSFRNCARVTRDGLRQAVRWKGKDIRRLAGDEVQIAVELYSPDCAVADCESPRLYAVYTNS